MKRIAILLLATTALLGPATNSFAGHGLTFDHAYPSFSTGVPDPSFQAGGNGATWELLATFPTGNPHTDIDYFTRDGETYMSAGTLAAGPNGGGQTILRLTDRGEVRPQFVAGHPSAACPSNPNSALGLQHDVEATPKGGAVLNASNAFAVKKDTQLILDASDADGRCHDNGTFGLSAVPQGGLEIVDVTVPTHPVEIGLTSHIGEAHTVNVDPKRPHIAYAVTSDSIGVDSNGKRANETPGGSSRLNLDGFEVVDLSSCMNFPSVTTIAERRARCRPEVYRYRFPSAQIAMGHTLKSSIYACHELEVYANDRLTCGSGGAGIVFDMKGAFNDNGTKNDFSDDKPRGKPLPCKVRPSSSEAPFGTGAMVTDCVNGERNGAPVGLDVPGWIADGSPSLQGVKYVGSVHHMGRGAGGSATPTYGSDEDVDFDHELELTASGKYLLATDERGGGVLPPGATCAPGMDNKSGNGGIHAYRVDKLRTTGPGTAQESQGSYATTPDGKRAIYRATIRTGPQPAFCTAHVFHQIPGQNRIFMGWYSQGTQVVDFVEHKDNRIEFKEAGWFLPANANTWASAVFKYKQNPDGTFTYWGATGDFNLGVGRSAIDVWKVTLPAPPQPR